MTGIGSGIPCATRVGASDRRTLPVATKPIIQGRLTTVEVGDAVLVADRSGCRVPVHSKIDSLANSASSLGLWTTGRSSTARNSAHAASSTMNRRRSARASRARATAASTVNAVMLAPSACSVCAVSAERRPDRHALLELGALLGEISALRAEGDAARFAARSTIHLDENGFVARERTRVAPSVTAPAEVRWPGGKGATNLGSFCHSGCQCI